MYSLFRSLSKKKQSVVLATHRLISWWRRWRYYTTKDFQTRNTLCDKLMLEEKIKLSPRHWQEGSVVLPLGELEHEDPETAWNKYLSRFNTPSAQTAQKETD